VFAVHQHRALGLCGLNGAQCGQHIGIIHMIGPVRQLDLGDTGGLEPGVIGLGQEVDHGGDLQFFQQRLCSAVGQGAAVQGR